MTRPIDLAFSPWAGGLTPSNYPAGGDPWAATSVQVAPANGYFTPNSKDGAQAMNYLIGRQSGAYAALVNWTALSTTLTTPGGLNALTGMIDGETRNIVGYGEYVFRSAATNYADGVLCVNGNGGTGRWLQVDYLQSRPRHLLTTSDQLSGAGVNVATATANAPDPANRTAGTVGFRILTTTNGAGAQFDLRNGDILRIHYSAELLIPTGQNSDLVCGVQIVNGNFFIPETINRGAQTTGSWPNGVLYAGLQRLVVNRSLDWVVGSSVTITPGLSYVELDVGCKNFYFGTVLQGSMLNVAHYRLVL